MLDLVDNDLKESHRPRTVQRDDATAQEDAARGHGGIGTGMRISSSLWDEITDMDVVSDLPVGIIFHDDADEALLDGAGF